MKTKHILTVGIAALCIGTAAQANDVVIRVTGSTAFRSAVNTAIKNVLSSGNPAYAYDNGATSFTGASYNIFVGTIPGLTNTTVQPSGGIGALSQVIIKTSWSGAVAGIRDVAQGNSIKFLPDNTTVTTGSGTAVAAPTAGQVEIADIAMGDNTQGSTAFKTPVIQSSFKVGIIPFAFVAGKDTLPSVTNITFQQHRALLTNGVVPTSVFSNNPSETQPIYATGRDPFSGTRLVTLAEDQYGTLNGVTQFKVINFTSGNTVGDIDLYPATATVVDAGNDGESSGGGVAKVLRYTTTNVNDVFTPYTGAASFIGYLGEADSYNAAWGLGNALTGTDQGNARYLTYNGVKGFDGQSKAPSSISITSGSPIVQLVAGAGNDTSNLVVGQIVFGTGINPGSSIVSIDTVNNRITLDKNATATNAAQTGVRIGSLIPSQIRNGNYTFWNYEYIMWKTGTPGTNIVGSSGDKFTAATALRNRIINFDYAAGGLADDASMKVQRGSDGGYVFPK
jgi:hypothetical protein